MPDLTPEEILLAQQIAYRKSLVRGTGQNPPPYDAEAAVGDFLEAAGEVSARRAPGITTGLEFSGWSIIHRTLAEYDQHFPQYAQQMQGVLEREFPGARVISEHFHQSAEEPIVIPPLGTQEPALADARIKARLAYDGAARSLLTARPPGTTGSNPSGNTPTAATSQPAVSANDVQGTWMVIVPIFQLEISDAAPINGRWDVGDVSFVSRAQLTATLKPPTLSSIPHPAVFQKITEEDKSFAIITLVGKPDELRRSVFRRLREAASILASTAAFYSKRHHVSGFTLKGYPAVTAKHDRFIQTDGTAFCGNWNQRGFLHPFVLDAAWHQAITQSGIVDLFARINDNTLTNDWRRQIRSGAAMLGRSLMSLDLADAFLLDVIGLETLLTRQGERNGRRLFQRIKGMTGWHLGNARPTYQNEITSIHRVRCEIVHDSDYSNLTVELLLQADMYLMNSLLNIVRLPAVFPDKATLANTLDGFAANENWPTDGSIPFRWFGNAQFSQADLDITLW
jgi:hypothetical protein